MTGSLVGVAVPMEIGSHELQLTQQVAFFVTNKIKENEVIFKIVGPDTRRKASLVVAANSYKHGAPTNTA